MFLSAAPEAVLLCPSQRAPPPQERGGERAHPPQERGGDVAVSRNRAGIPAMCWDPVSPSLVMSPFHLGTASREKHPPIPIRGTGWSAHELPERTASSEAHFTFTGRFQMREREGFRLHDCEEKYIFISTLTF